MSTVTNPLSGLIEGLLQGHALATQMHRQQQEDQAFKTNQALHEQHMSMQDIMNRQMLQESAVPVSAMGTVENPAVQGPDNPIPGTGQAPGLPSFQRKADASRTVKYGGQSYELRTPEDQQKRALDRQISGQSQLETASVKAKGEADEAELDRKRQLRGVPVPTDLAANYPAAQYPHGLLQEEIMQARASVASARNANLKEIPKEGTLFDTSTGKVVAQGAPKDLSEPEQLALSAVQRVAAAHNIPFDRNKNPQDPRAQIPTSLHGEIDAVIARAKTDPAVAAQLAATRSLQADAITSRRDDQRTNTNNRRSDQSYTQNTRELDNMRKPVDSAVQRIGELQDLVNANTPQADVLVAPKLLSVLAGGQGSGVRVNQAEINQITHGQSGWEDLKKAINKWSLDPKSATSIMPEQRRQIRALVQTVADKMSAKQKALDDAATDLIAHEDPTEHRKIVDKARKSLAGIDAGQSAGAVPDAVKRVLSGAGPGIHTLSDGSRWMTAADGTISKQ